jgi:hypothetical protein
MGIIRSIDALQEPLAQAARRFLARCGEEHIPVLVIETNRTQAVQDAYYAQGRKLISEVNALRKRAGLYLIKERKNRVITKARVSNHTGGCALDVCPEVPGRPGGRGGITRILNCWPFNGASGVLGVLVVAGCQSRPLFRADAVYRSIEREANQTETELAITGADIAGGAERLEHQATRVISGLDSLGVAIGGSCLEDGEKEALLHQVAVVQQEAETLREQVGVLRKDAGRLNEHLAEQREINATLSVEHDNREVAGAVVEAELESMKEELVKVKGQRNLCLTLLIA